MTTPGGRSASYDVAVYAPARLVRLTLGGFCTADQADAIIREVRAAIDGLGGEPNTHVTLVDVREAKLQPQEVIAAFGAQMALPRYRSRRLAFVVGSSVARMQVKRLLERGDADVFDDPHEAQRWLSSSP